MLDEKDLRVLLKYYRYIKDVTPVYDTMMNSLHGLTDKEIEIAREILSGMNRRSICKIHNIGQTKYYKIRTKVILNLKINLRKEDLHEFYSVFE